MLRAYAARNSAIAAMTSATLQMLNARTGLEVNSYGPVQNEVFEAERPTWQQIGAIPA